MRSNIVFERYQEVFDAEVAAIIDTREAFRYAASGICNPTDELNYFDPENPDHVQDYELSTHPRISHGIFSELYFNLGRKYDHKNVDRLLEYIGQTLIPISGVKPQEQPADAVLMKGIYSGQCELAEPYFGDCLTQIKGGKQDSQNMLGVYHDTNGTPLLLRKFYDSSTAITLRPMSFIGSAAFGDLGQAGTAHVPAGCVVSIRDSESELSSKPVVVDDVEYATWAAEKPLPVYPQRFTPWAYKTPEDRLLFALKQRNNPTGTLVLARDRRKLFEHTSLDDLQSAARKIMAICGVQTPKSQIA